MTDQHLAQTCCHCGRRDCPTTRAHPFPWCAPDQSASVYGAHASAREDYLTEECARAEERAERMRHRGDVWRMRAERVHANSCEDSGRMVMELNEARATLKIMRGQVQPLQDAYQAEHVALMRMVELHRDVVERLAEMTETCARIEAERDAYKARLKEMGDRHLPNIALIGHDDTETIDRLRADNRRLMGEVEKLIGFNRAMVRLPSWEAK
jgi:hypothetical protein